MGLSSAMTTALTGLQAAETMIDVAGNNLANSQTVGFKASDVVFATQFLRTLSPGSAPGGNSGGTNPRQLGLGVQVAEISPDFSQGTVEVSSSASDLAIQGDGFFIVGGSQGEPLYTRNGIFKTNSHYELVSATGNRLLGFGVDELYNLETTHLVPLTIPLGAAVSVQATRNVYLNGNLTPTGDLANTAAVIQSEILGDGSLPRPNISTTTLTPVDDPTGPVNGLYSYLMTFSGPGIRESRPSEMLGPLQANGRVDLGNLPSIPAGPGVPAYDTVHIYRNLAANQNQFYHVAAASPGGSYTDLRSDADISDPTDPANRELDMAGPRITSNTLLTNVIKRNGLEYQTLFEEGQLAYTGRKGGNVLTPKSLQITDETTVGQFLQFISQASGIQTSSPGDPNPIPGSINRIPGESGTLEPGTVVTADGRIRVVSNNGTSNAMAIPASAFQLVRADGSTGVPSLGFGTIQNAVGQSASSSFLVYDSLGVPLDVRLTTVLQGRDSDATTYRWFADSGGNDPQGSDRSIAVGTGLITFDGEGNLIQANDAVVHIQRHNFPSVNPLEFNLDFSHVSGFASDTSELAATRQDGSAVGMLTSYSVGERGEIMGVFTNGNVRTLGQVRLARFANPVGLEQRGQNLFGIGFNSGLPVEGNPGDLSIGNIVAGAVELSNTDTGENLVNLLLASTQYRANSRVISTAQQLLDDLMNMRR